MRSLAIAAQPGTFGRLNKTSIPLVNLTWCIIGSSDLRTERTQGGVVLGAISNAS
jgi:hypothetical protein